MNDNITDATNVVRPLSLNLVEVPDKPFSISQTHITQKQWLDVCGDTAFGQEVASRWTVLGDDIPATHLSWIEANMFCAKLTLATGKVFTLPTSRDWEHAMTCGTGQVPEPIEEYAVFERDEIVRAATLKPNTWGIYDPFGLVWCWCADRAED